ncbi:MAG TPA: LysR family transcriptional regulator [Burkholderiaceae bacterium]
MLDALELFLAVASAGTFSQVAKDRAIAVSSVTRRVDALEAEVGARLFNRSPRRILLTDAGEQFLPRARAILADLAEAKDALAALNADPRGVIVVAAPATFGRIAVVPAVASFLERCPHVEVELHLSDDYLDLSAQRVDVAVRIGALEASELIATRLAPMRLVACASPAYLARHGRPRRPEELLRHACIDIATGAAPHQMWCFDGANQGKPLRVRGRLRVDDRDAMRDAALAGAGIVHIASWLVHEDIAAGRLVELFPGRRPPPARGIERAIHAVRLPGRSNDAKARLFTDHLRETFGDPPYWDRALGRRRA